MRHTSLKIIFCFLSSILFVVCESNAQEEFNEKHIEVSLRMIGHQVLLNSGDSISRVLPILKENGNYRLQFESEFEFTPDKLVAIVDRVVKDANLAVRYIVEVEQCETKETVYSFEMDNLGKSDIVPCADRSQPKSCYSLLFTFLPPEETISAITTPIEGSSNERHTVLKYSLISVLLLLVTIGLYFLWKRKRRSSSNAHLISLGAYYFDKRNSELIIEEQRIELTSKEADLLLLLYDAANTPVERGVILNRVWGDEGDYIGRTLDVFISKLRKKLEFDSKVKIVNIRGIGYKLVLDV
ncbi:winged helix-turn-helix domain-containing protein [Geojedonia litorea]|uniref:Winged helix-turn-helix domain-containing protein n=1 Tax=Geojedonia litorea TaxID=1268269 RepID=A0ABV9N5G3_9FLAO